MTNRVKVQICGITLNISTDESPEYLRDLAEQMNEQVAAIMNSSARVSLNDALTLTAINYADGFKKSEKTADRLRAQLAEYLEDAARTRIELDESRRELERLRRELAALEKSGKAQQMTTV